MSNIYNIVSDMNISNGETKRINCPVCNGYKTFTVTNSMGSLVWNCYKASCGTKGGTRVRMSVDDIRNTLSDAERFAEESFELPPYIVNTCPCTQADRFCARWGLDFNETWV